MRDSASISQMVVYWRTVRRIVATRLCSQLTFAVYRVALWKPEHDCEYYAPHSSRFSLMFHSRNYKHNIITRYQSTAWTVLHTLLHSLTRLSTTNALTSLPLYMYNPPIPVPVLQADMRCYPSRRRSTFHVHVSTHLTPAPESFLSFLCLYTNESKALSTCACPCLPP